jgi:hypothetical protein
MAKESGEEVSGSSEKAKAETEFARKSYKTKDLIA